jgi:threonine/homoserine/homoserine lactone efflux protein
MNALQVFLIAFIFSFVGSIPPGTLNLTVLQLGLNQQMRLAWRFAIAAALVEYPYAWMAVKFAELITSSPVILRNIKLLSAAVMLAVGIMGLWSARRPTQFIKKFEQSGLRRGFILSFLNPLAIPFWFAITAYLTAQEWIQLDSPIILHSYLAGVSFGAFALLVSLAHVAQKLIKYLEPDSWVKYVPGITLILLGLYALTRYLF